MSDLEVFKQQLVLIMMSIIGDYRSELFKLVKPKIATGIIRIQDMDGGNKITTQTTPTKPAAAKVYGFESKSNPKVREVNVPLMDTQYRNAAEAAAYVAPLLIQRMWDDICDLAWFLFFTGRTIAHPLNGVAGSPILANGGGTMFMFDEFAVTPINGASGFVQATDHNLALTPSNLNTLLLKRPTLLDKDKRPSRPRGLPWLVVCHALGQQAQNYFDQDGPVYDGVGLTYGFKRRLKGVLVAPPSATVSNTAWSLVWEVPRMTASGAVEETCPVNLQLVQLPTIRALPAHGGGYVDTYASYEADAYYHPLELDMLYSEPP